MLKIALVLVKNVFFGLKKGISELLHWVAAKHTADSIVGDVLFLKFFPKTRRKWVLFKAGKRIQVMYTSSISFFRASPEYLNLKLF